MKLVYFLLTLSFVIMGLTGFAQAQSEEVILIKEVLAHQVQYEKIQKDIWDKGFDADPASFIRSSVNNIEIFDRRSGLTYNFLRARTLTEAKSACQKIKHRLASFTEIERLHSISHVDEISKLITIPGQESLIFGFNDDEYDYFKMNVKTLETEFFKRPAYKQESPVVCVK